MQKRQLSPFYLFPLCTAFIIFQSACPASSEDAYSNVVTSTSIRPEEEETSTILSSSTEGKVNDEQEEVKSAIQNQLDGMESTTSKSLTDETVITSTTILPSVKLYRLRDDACILLETDASLTLTYLTKAGEERDESGYIPEDVEIQGDCSEADTETFIMKWSTYVLKWSFAKTPGHEEWYVSGIELRVYATSEQFQNINTQGTRTLSKTHAMLFPTRAGKSYSCDTETTIDLLDGDMSAKLVLQQFKLQAFNEKSDFGPAFECTAGGARAYRDETAPLAVGSTLAIVVLLTVTSYGVYRYFKIKKVQYDTME